MRTFHPADYGPVLAATCEGRRDRAARSRRARPRRASALELATVEAAFAQTPLANRDMAACTIAGLWLVHDFLDESHRISQIDRNADRRILAWHHASPRRRLLERQILVSPRR